MIKIFGIGDTGTGLANSLRARCLDEELHTAKASPCQLKFIGVETDTATLGCSTADLGIYLGGGSDGKHPDACKVMHERARDILAHIVAGSYFVILFVDLHDPMGCAAGLAAAELAQARQVVTVSLVTLPDAAPDTDQLDWLSRLQAESDVLYASKQRLASTAGLTSDLIDCAHTLLKALFLPPRQLIACDFQDIRTALATSLSERTGHGAHPNLSYLRITADLDTPLAQWIEDSIAPLRLPDATRVLIYLEGGTALRLNHVREIVMSIRAQAPTGSFIKYCAQINGDKSEQGLVIHVCSIMTAGPPQTPLKETPSRQAARSRRSRPSA